MADPADDTGAAAEDLVGDVLARKTWFFECQLRKLNLGSFRDVVVGPDALLDLISEPLLTWGFPAGQIGGTMKSLGQVYLDDQQPVWTPDEHARRDAFAATFIGERNNWLGYRSGARLGAKLVELRRQFEASRFGSDLDLGNVDRFSRGGLADDDGKMGRAISRASLAAAKPWLIPELYVVTEPDDKRPIENWIANLEAFVVDFESDLGVAIGATPGQSPASDADGAAYRDRIKAMLVSSLAADGVPTLKARLLTRTTNADGSVRFDYDAIQIETPAFPMGKVADFPASQRLKYWTGIVKPALGEVYVSKPNADMGLCHVLRTIYLFGTLPATLGPDDALAWRKRDAPGDEFNAFFDERAKQLTTDDDALRAKLRSGQEKLRAILEESALRPRSAAPVFSPLAQEIVRQALHAFKFWLDEPLRVSDNATLQQARTDTKIAGADDADVEMEYWSENHYIMFASSEFLAGQLWEADAFQPAQEFLDPDSTSGILYGRDRQARGKARLLKWMNNRLMFGWMEFNSSGYYREHLWSLLNLIDFSLDDEVRKKAALVVDLLLFDASRYLHKGAMGAAGGRSQFKSKGSGWDNALCDVVEILFGSRGVFCDADGQMGAALSTSTYVVPAVLLEIGVHPPDVPVIDRSRVSVTFEEAGKYGIDFSQKSDQRDSVIEGYAPKRDRYYPFIGRTNQAITATHAGYGASEDDTVFWWGMSAFFNKQNVRNTFKAVDKFGLAKSKAFAKLSTLVKLMSFYEGAQQGVIGGIIGGVVGGPIGGIAGTAIGFFKDGVLSGKLEEDASDDLSLLLEGSTRTRANIVAYRSRDVMLSSIQNFRPGQFNFQSNVFQATLNPTVNVLINAGFADIDISDLEAAIGGGFLGGALGSVLSAALAGGTGGILPLVLGVAGVVSGIAVNEAALTNEDVLADHEDGPGWWTGSWALPMIVQHRSAAILAFDFRTVQTVLADAGTHAWFPKAGFDAVAEMRTSAYDDANFALLDIGSIGPKGFWLFGKIVHPADAMGEAREAYVGVFSNRRPGWQDQGSEFYEQRIKKQIRDPTDALDKKVHAKLSDLGSDALVVASAVQRAIDATYVPDIRVDDWIKSATERIAAIDEPVVKKRLAQANELAGLQIQLRERRRIWPDPLPSDDFADHDWYAEGKNVWIVQVGSRDEFGDFETFKQRVSSARIHLDDAGDQECTYDIPGAGDTSERLTLAYGDGGRFSLNGESLQTDLFPRFECDFIRGGRVEWGQRAYVIAYRDKSLLHDFSDFESPLRSEQPTFTSQERNVVKALVLFMRTADVSMDAFTVATCDVRIGCDDVTAAQVIAAGPVDEEVHHDAEWVFFDFSATRSADMTLVVTHPASSEGDETPHWRMSFSLFALMGDLLVRPCSLSFAGFEFEDDRRSTPSMPFSIALDEWRPWSAVEDSKPADFWLIGRGPPFAVAYQGYCDLVLLDDGGRLWHRRLRSCRDDASPWSDVTQSTAPEGPDFQSAFSAAAVSMSSAAFFLLVQSRGRLFVRRVGSGGAWTEPWTRLVTWIYPDLLFGLPDRDGAPIAIALSDTSVVAALPSSSAAEAVRVVVLGADGHFYGRTLRLPDDVSAWRKIDVTGFTPRPGSECLMLESFLFVLAIDSALWVAPIDDFEYHAMPAWQRLSVGQDIVSGFTAIEHSSGCPLVAAFADGRVAATTFRAGTAVEWTSVDLPGARSSPPTSLTCASVADGHATFLTIAGDGRVHAIEWSAASGWNAGAAWSEVSEGDSTIDARPDGGLAAVARVAGQLECFAQDRNRALHVSWRS